MIHVHFSLCEEKINRRQGWSLQIRGAVRAKWRSFLLCLLGLATNLTPGDFSVALTDVLQDKKRSIFLGSFVCSLTILLLGDRGNFLHRQEVLC